MRILFITQKLKEQDAFGVLWVREFIRQGFGVTVVCLEASGESFEFPVISMGKESGAGKLRAMLNFERIIMKEKYDRVFIHMSPVWYALGFWFWMIKGIPTYLWYTHYKMQIGVRLFSWFGKRFFCATPQSLPQYEGSVKKIVLGHGIDLRFWPKRRNQCMNPKRLLVVHRLSRSKRVEILLRALPLLDSAFTIDIYGIEAEPSYVSELKNIVEDLKLNSRVTFHGTIPMNTLHDIYTRHRLLLNMASETIDKTMLEAMTCGCYPVTTAANAQAIGLAPTPACPVGRPSPSPEGRGENFSPEQDTPESVAAFIKTYVEQAPIDADAMYSIVEKRHSLAELVKNMSKYIRAGN